MQTASISESTFPPIQQNTKYTAGYVVVTVKFA